MSTTITSGPGLVSMRATWGPGLVSMRAAWGPGLVGSLSAGDLCFLDGPELHVHVYAYAYAHMYMHLRFLDGPNLDGLALVLSGHARALGGVDLVHGTLDLAVGLDVGDRRGQDLVAELAELLLKGVRCEV